METIPIMLPVECPSLPVELAEYLAEQRRREAPWNSLYRPRKAAAIKQVLRTAFHEKCGYCEQIEAQTVDHFIPQAGNIDARGRKDVDERESQQQNDHGSRPARSPSCE